MADEAPECTFSFGAVKFTHGETVALSNMFAHPGNLAREKLLHEIQRIAVENSLGNPKCITLENFLEQQAVYCNVRALLLLPGQVEDALKPEEDDESQEQE